MRVQNRRKDKLTTLILISVYQFTIVGPIILIAMPFMLVDNISLPWWSNLNVYTDHFGWPFVKRFAICYQTVVRLSVTLVYCGQTVGWIKMKLGMWIGLGPSYTVLDGNSAPARKGAQQPPRTFEIRRPYNPRLMSIVTKRLDGSRCHLVRRYALA